MKSEIILDSRFEQYMKVLENELKDTVHRLIPNIVFSIKPLTLGNNNRLFELLTKECKYIIKCYFTHKDDRRDRLNSEYMFSSFVWNNGIRCIAEPIAKDENNSLGIYRFIEGRSFYSGEIGEKEVEQAINFFNEINRYKSSNDAFDLPHASEACFSFEDHIKVIDYRIGRFRTIEVKDDIDTEAYKFINNDLVVKWSEIKGLILSKINSYKICYSEKIPLDDMVLSPSDFGFHNAVLDNGGFIRFVDFEYAGWDDPAKMICDFFCQVAVPVPMFYFENFLETVIKCVKSPEETLMRVRLLFPLYQIKWCCIVLNHFLPVDRVRKEFAVQDAMRKKHDQLDKARLIIRSIK